MMSDTKRNRIRRLWQKSCRAALLALLLLMCFCSLAYAKDAGAVAAAKCFQVSDGTFVRNKKGIRYRMVNGKYIQNRWAMIDEDIYLFNTQGYVRKGSFSWRGSSYRADDRGRLYVDRFYTAKGKTFYYGPTGARLQGGWKTIGERQYYFGKNGVMARKCWVGGYHVDSSGQKQRNCFVSGHYLDSRGKRVDNLSVRQIRENRPADAGRTKKRLIIIGASRVLHMADDVSGDEEVIYFAKMGKGYSWLKNTVYQPLCRYLTVYPESTVVFQLGNNDITVEKREDGNIQRYAAIWKKLMKAYPKASFYFMDALPWAGKPEVNKKLRRFNHDLQKRFPSQSIGGYDYMMKTGFTPKSATNISHYSPETNRMLYQYILDRCGWTD